MKYLLFALMLICSYSYGQGHNAISVHPQLETDHRKMFVSEDEIDSIWAYIKSKIIPMQSINLQLQIDNLKKMRDNDERMILILSSEIIALRSDLDSLIRSMSIFADTSGNNIYHTAPLGVIRKHHDNLNCFLVLDNIGAKADGYETNKLHAHIEDRRGNPLEGVAMKFFAIPEDGLDSNAVAITQIGSTGTDKYGNLDVIVSSIKAGWIKVGAKIIGSKIEIAPRIIIFY